MLGRVKSESGFDVSVSYVSDVCPEGSKRLWEMRIAVVSTNNLFELLEGNIDRV